MWGELLYLLGFSRIYNSVWLWGPLGLLLLNSLLALAEFGPTAWRRFRQRPPQLDWQHPLANRVEHSVRLPATPDERLAALRTRLTKHGFAVGDLPDENDRAVSATQRGWVWPAIIAFYGGVLLLVVGFLLSHHHP